jgi:hypothetical protein
MRRLLSTRGCRDKKKDIKITTTEEIRDYMTLHGTAWHYRPLHGTTWHCMALKIFFLYFTVTALVMKQFMITVGV